MYDDGETKRHDFAEERWKLLTAEECEAGWEAFELRCAISLQPLEDPARSERCSHRSRCNYDVLKQYVTRHRACPVSGCASGVVRTREIVRDTVLCAQLRALPAGTHTVWRRGNEVRSVKPVAEGRPSKRRAQSI